MAPDQVLHAAHELAGLAVLHLAHGHHWRRTQILEHLLELAQQLPCRFARARARHFLHAVDHVLQVAPGQCHGVGINRLHFGAVFELPHHVLGQCLHEAVDGVPKPLHQALDLFLGRVVGQRLHELPLQVTQVSIGQGHVPFLDPEGGVPQQLLHLPHRILATATHQARLGRHQGQVDHQIVVEGLGLDGDGGDATGDRHAGRRLAGQALALLDDCLGHRVRELALGQDHGEALGAARLAGTVTRLELDLDRQPGPRVRRQIAVTRRLRGLQAASRKG